MGIKLGSKPVIAFKGDHEPVNMAKGNTKVTGWRRELLSGTELSFYNTYKDSVSLSIEGNTKVSDEVYREKTGKTVVIPASEHKKSNADKVLISGNTVQMSDWYGVNGQSSQYQDTKVMGKNLSWVNSFTGTVFKTTPTTNAIDRVIIHNIPIDPTKTYTVTSKRPSNMSLVAFPTTVKVDESLIGHNSMYSHVTSTGIGVQLHTGTIPTGYNYLTLTTGGSFSDSYYPVGEVLTWSEIQVEEGSTATAYEPYKDTVKNGLVLEYNGKNFFNSPQTTSLKDRSGNGNHGTPYGFAYNSTSGSDGDGGIVFDGVDDYIKSDFITCIDYTGKFTVDMVITNYENVTTNGDTIFQNSLSGSNRVGGNLWDNNRVTFGYYDDVSWKGLSGYLDPTRDENHVVFSCSNGELKLVINGEESTTTGSLYVYTGGFYLGKDSAERSKLKATVKRFSVYNRVLSESEIYQNYLAGTSLNMPSPEDPSPVVSNLPAGTYKYTSTDGIYEFTLDEELRGISDVTDKVVFDRASKNGYLSKRIGTYNVDITSIGTLNPTLGLIYASCTIPDKVVGTVGLISEKAKYTTIRKTPYEIYENPGNVCFIGLSTDTLQSMRDKYNNSIVLFARKTSTKTPITFTKVSSSTAPEVPMQFITSEISPDYPAGMYDVEEGNVVSRGKNIINIKDFFSPSSNIYVSFPSENSLLVEGTNQYNRAILRNFNLKKGTTYTLSLYATRLVETNSSSVMLLDKNGKTLYTKLLSNTLSRQFVSFSYTPTIDIDDCQLWLYSNYGTNTLPYVECLYEDIQIEEGSTATPYESHISTKSTTPLLRKVDTVADTYNPLTGEYVQRIGVKVFDGSETWSIGSDNYNNIYRYYSYSLNLGYNRLNDIGLCSHLPRYNSVLDKESLVIGLSNTPVYLFLNKQNFPNILSVNNWMVNQHTNGTPVTIYYQLATPIVTYLEPNLTPLYDVDTYIESDSAIAQPDITVGYELKDGVITSINDITEPHPDYPRVIDGVGEYDEVNDDYNLEVYSGIGGRNLLAYKNFWSYSPTVIFDKENAIVYGSGNWYFGFRDVHLVNDTSYTVSYKSTTTSRFAIYIKNKRTGKAGYAVSHVYGTGTSLKVPSSIADVGVGIYDIQVYFNYGATETFSIEKIKMEQGTQATPWTPAPEDIQYNTPTSNTFKTLHNFPIEMNRVGDIADEYTPPFWGAGYDGDGRNLVANSLLKNVPVGSGSTFIANVEINTQYVISFKYRVLEGSPTGFLAYIYDADNATVNKGFLAPLNDSVSGYTSVAIKETRSMGRPVLRLYSGVSNAQGTTTNVDFYDIKLERGSTPTPWTPSSGEFVQRIGKRIMTGMESFSIMDGYTGHYRFNMGVPVKPNTNIVCSHFKDGNTGLGVNIASVHGSSQMVMFCPSTNLIPSTSKWNDWLTQQYTIGNPVTLYYVLNTPVLSTITGSAIPTFFPVTKVEVFTDGTKPKLQGTARVVDLLETDF